jgi:carnitine-CoA ligase
MTDIRILANLIEQKAKDHPELDLLTFVNVLPSGEFADETRRYGDLWENGQQIADALIKAEMTPGDSFALVMQNHPEFVDAMVGSSIAGTVFVPVDPRTKGDKLNYMLNWADCKGVFCADYCLSQVMEVCEQLENIKWIWVLETGEGIRPSVADKRLTRFSEIKSAPYEKHRCRVKSPEEPMQMLYTSGTTGDPKAILAPYLRYDAVSSLGPNIGMREGDKLYTGLSLTHANAQLVTLGNALKMSLPTVISLKFTKSRLWDICRHYGCTQFNLLGGMTTAIYSEPVHDNDAENPVRYILSAGMPAAIWNDFSNRFGVEIFEFYAAAEGGMMMNPPGYGPIGSIGKPPPNLSAKIIDDEGNVCGPGVRGEIVFESLDPGVELKVQYYKNPEASAKKANKGLLYMGDIGHYDEDGWFYFDSRKGDEIRRNGEFIDVAKIEKSIAEFDGVEDVFVYGVPALSGAPGEKDVIAAVVPVEARVFRPEALLAHCRKNLGKAELPSYIQVMSEIPKTASEKPQARFCYEHFKEQKNHIYDFCESQSSLNAVN